MHVRAELMWRQLFLSPCCKRSTRALALHPPLSCLGLDPPFWSKPPCQHARAAAPIAPEFRATSLGPLMAARQPRARHPHWLAGKPNCCERQPAGPLQAGAVGVRSGSGHMIGPAAVLCPRNLDMRGSPRAHPSPSCRPAAASTAKEAPPANQPPLLDIKLKPAPHPKAPPRNLARSIPSANIGNFIEKSPC